MECEGERQGLANLTDCPRSVPGLPVFRITTWPFRLTKPASVVCFASFIASASWHGIDSIGSLRQGFGDVDAAERGSVSLDPPTVDDERVLQLILQQYPSPKRIILLGDLIAGGTAASDDLVTLFDGKAHEITTPIEPNKDEAVGIEIGMLARREPCSLRGQS